MEINYNKELIFELLNNNSDLNNVEIAKLYNQEAGTDYPLEQLRRGISRYRLSHQPFIGEQQSTKKTELVNSESITKVNNDKGTFESITESTFLPRTHEQLAKLHHIDLSKYKISSYWSKLKSNGKFTSSVFCTLKKPKDIKPEDILKVLEDYKTEYIPFTKEQIYINKNFENKSMAFIDLTDFHLDKRTIDEYPIDKKIADFHRILDVLIKKSYQSNHIDEIAFIVGSDFCHTDNYYNSTTKSTPQEITLRWNEAFSIGFDIYVQSINKLKQFCNKLNVILIQGNHSVTKEYYLAFALQKYFEKDINIIFDIRPIPRKVFTYGSTFIGLHHGNTKIETLPLVFSKEFSKEWGAAKYHEIKVGDKHHYMEKDYSGVRIKQLPALSGIDTWHNDSNYINSVQAAICSIYDYEKGRVMDIEERL